MYSPFETLLFCSIRCFQHSVVPWNMRQNNGDRLHTCWNRTLIMLPVFEADWLSNQYLKQVRQCNRTVGNNAVHITERILTHWWFPLYCTRCRPCNKQAKPHFKATADDYTINLLFAILLSNPEDQNTVNLFRQDDVSAAEMIEATDSTRV